MSGWFAVIFIEYVFRMIIRSANLVRSRNWPVVPAAALSAECPDPWFECSVATIYYEYVVNGEKYGAAYGKPFISRDSGRDYAGHFAKGTNLKVRVKPGNPMVSVPIE